jgi:hypothetical protein
VFATFIVVKQINASFFKCINTLPALLIEAALVATYGKNVSAAYAITIAFRGNDWPITGSVRETPMINRCHI